MPELQTIEAAPPAMSGSLRAEFGPQQMAPETVSELAALERQINESAQKPEVTSLTPPQTPMRVETVPAQNKTTSQPVDTKSIPIPADISVPDKFKNPDGTTFNGEAVEKSLVNLEHYLKMEKEMNQPKSQNPQPQTQTFQQPPQWAAQPAPSFEQRLNEDLQKDPGQTIANVARAIAFEAEQKSSSQITELKRRLELMEIGSRDPGVFTKDGAEKLQKTLAENPWLWNSPTPWANAYKISGPISANGQQVNAPARRQAAPILPGGPAPTIPQGSTIASEADLRRYLDSRNPNDPFQQAETLDKIIQEMAKSR